MTVTIAYLGADAGYQALVETLGGAADAVHVEANPNALSQALETASGLLDASMAVPISDAMIDAAPNLKIISCATTGADHIARDSAQAKGIAIHTLREDADLLANLTPAAELSWALLMAVARSLPAAVAHTRAGLWRREDFPGTMVQGRTLGLVGVGRIGGWMARYAQAFGMSVLGYDPYQDTLSDGVKPATMEDLFGASDFVSVHVHLSDETRGLVNRALLESAKPGQILINTSRGAIVDEAALLDGLKSGRLGGAGLDVLDGEPDTVNHPLVVYSQSHENVLITPHCGGLSPDAVRLVCARAGQKIMGNLRL
jgi:phosphoglycerate dehydrogenase-like enzyme